MGRARDDWEQEFAEYVAGRGRLLCKTAYLLCGDWHRAEDLAQIALTKLYLVWRRISQVDNVDAYARRTLVNTYLDEARRPWRREHLSGFVPDRAGREESSDDRVTLLSALSVAWWTITSGAKAGELQASASGPGPVKPDQYRQWQQQDPCAGYPNSESTCSFTRHGEALVYVTHRSGTLSPPRTTPPTALSKPAVAIHEEQIQVFALWPDGSGVSLSESTAKHDAAAGPALGTLPLTEQQMVEVALNPSLRS